MTTAIDLIVEAFQAFAGASLSTAGSSAAQQLISKLKERLHDRPEALSQLEASDPNLAALRAHLAASGAGQDAELVELAARVRAETGTVVMGDIRTGGSGDSYNGEVVTRSGSITIHHHYRGAPESGHPQPPVRA